jgi:hypothetical protein
MILESVISTVATLVAAGYAAHKIENVFLARRGYDTRNFFKPDPIPADDTVAEPPVKLWTDEDARQQALSFIAHPSAFWLDPNFFGDDPDWRERLFPAAPVRVQDRPRLGEPGYIDPVREHHAAYLHGQTKITGNLLWSPPPAIYEPRQVFKAVMREEPAPLCPVCHTGRRMVLTDHGGEATSWGCVDCDAEFTRAGETRSSKKRRKRLAKRHDYDNDLPLPPSME